MKSKTLWDWTKADGRKFIDSRQISGIEMGIKTTVGQFIVNPGVKKIVRKLLEMRRCKQY